MANLVLALLLSGACFSAFPAGSSQNSVENEVEIAEEYLKNFYDFNTHGVRLSRTKRNNLFSRKLREMQRFFGLKETGKLDPATVQVMHQSRCGFPDAGEITSTGDSKIWNTNALTYRFENYTPDLYKDEVEKAIKQAFNAWSKYIPLTFTQVYEKPSDIDIKFTSKAHLSCVKAFDGAGNILAHAYFPHKGGDVHFDEDEKWAVKSKGINLTTVAAHEFGHSLGLNHSNNEDALMYPNYKNRPTDLLHTDDIKRIQHLYSKNKIGHLFREENKMEESEESGEPPSHCPPGSSFDAVATLAGETLFFKDSNMWRQITLDSPPEHYPINQLWSKLPNDIEAAYEYSDNTKYRIFFFKGTKFWVTEDFDVRSDSPKDISQLGFPHRVKNIDAAVHDQNTGKTFFFVNDQYWSYNEKKRRMDAGFPKPIASGFPGIGVPVQSAFQKDGYLYFFDNQNLYQFDNKKQRVVAISKENKWLKC